MRFKVFNSLIKMSKTRTYTNTRLKSNIRIRKNSCIQGRGVTQKCWYILHSFLFHFDLGIFLQTFIHKTVTKPLCCVFPPPLVSFHLIFLNESFKYTTAFISEQLRSRNVFARIWQIKKKVDEKRKTHKGQLSFALFKSGRIPFQGRHFIHFIRS